jgi:hypothetical protein
VPLSVNFSSTLLYIYKSELGPLIGGSFSNLGTKYPSLGYEFILTYPYFMPNFVCSLLVMAGFFLAYFFLEEVRARLVLDLAGN